MRLRLVPMMAAAISWCLATSILGLRDPLPAGADQVTPPTSVPATPPGEPPPPAGIQFAPPHPAQLLASSQAAKQAAGGALQAAALSNAQAQATLSDAVDTQSTAAARLAELQGRAYQAAVALVAAKDRMKRLAVDDFVNGGESSVELGSLLQSSNLEELGRRQALVGALSSNLRGAEISLQRAQREAEGAATPAASELSQANEAVSTAQTEVGNATGRLKSAQDADSTASAELALIQMAAPAPGSDIPAIVLQAYQHAANAFALIEPSCHISWPDIAALGRIESGHAQHADTQLAANGDTYPPILGPPLDGSGGNAALAQPAGLTYYDGPGPWEQAVGPMQFIPTSWATSAMVGGSDASPDPNNVFDAAMGAANYLCRAVGGQGLDTLGNLTAAYYSYNHSESYVSEALSNAVYYGASITPITGA